MTPPPSRQTGHEVAVPVFPHEVVPGTIYLWNTLLMTFGLLKSLLDAVEGLNQLLEEINSGVVPSDKILALQDVKARWNQNPSVSKVRDWILSLHHDMYEAHLAGVYPSYQVENRVKILCSDADREINRLHLSTLADDKRWASRILKERQVREDAAMALSLHNQINDDRARSIAGF